VDELGREQSLRALVAKLAPGARAHELNVALDPTDRAGHCAPMRRLDLPALVV